MSKNKLDKGTVIGTNCYNCKFIAEKEMAVDPKELNDEGGIDPRNNEENRKSQKS
jgi:hypothetical protein